MDFVKELQTLINQCCLENESNTPDFILAEYVRNCLAVLKEKLDREDYPFMWLHDKYPSI